MDGRGLRVQGYELSAVQDAPKIRVRSGEGLVADGPFAEAKEQIAGFDILDYADLPATISQ